MGNLLPHPVTLFACIALFIVLFSGLAEFFDFSVLDPRPLGAKGRADDGMIRVISLLNAEGIRRIIVNLVKNFTDFAPLGTVLVALLGVGVAEHSGLLSGAIRSMVLSVSKLRSNKWMKPTTVVTLVVVFAGVISNTAAEMGYVVLIPLAGVIFFSMGRHPIAGMAAAFAGTSGGYSANLLIGTVDPLLSGITTEAARIIAPEYTAHPAINWYFMIVSTFLITGLGTWITIKIVEPRLGKYNPKNSDGSLDSISKMDMLTKLEKKGLKWAGIATLLLVLLICIGILPSNGILRNPETGGILDSSLLKGMVAFIFIFFFIPGVVYGKITKSFKSDKDVIEAMSKSMSSLGLYMVLVFFAAQFVAYFNWTNIGPVVAILGADGLKALSITGPIIFVFFIIMCAFVNLALGSASAQWAVTAPVFVPMLMLVGYSPEVIQAAYRIGDSVTNIITPMMSYFGLILAFMHKYDKKIGVGTIISTMLPYSILFFIGWTILFYIWVFVLKMPVGPGTSTYFNFQ